MDAQQLDILKLDYTSSRTMIDKFDTYIMQTMAWAIASCGGVLYTGLTKRSLIVTSSAILVALFFNLFAYIFKTFQLDIIRHSEEIESILQTASFKGIGTSYRFGVGHSVQPLRFRSLWAAMSSSVLSYQHLFFALICLLALLADWFIVLDSR